MSMESVVLNIRELTRRSTSVLLNSTMAYTMTDVMTSPMMRPVNPVCMDSESRYHNP